MKSRPSPSDPEIDRSTHPHCRLIPGQFEWGEPYAVMEPIFNIPKRNSQDALFYSIEALGQNNFPILLNELYNKIVNREERESLNNWDGEIENRKAVLKLILEQIAQNNGRMTPWLKYRPYVEGHEEEKLLEYEFVERLEAALGHALVLPRRENR